jgi:hypothetical protein
MGRRLLPVFFVEAAPVAAPMALLPRAAERFLADLAGAAAGPPVHCAGLLTAEAVSQDGSLVLSSEAVAV